MTKQALHSRMAATLMNAEHSHRRDPTPEQILALSLEQMMAQLKEDNGWWGMFVEKYQVIFVNGSFYDPDGRID